MREDAFQYHQRVVEEFLAVLFSKQDASNEAANVLFSGLNLRRHGISYTPLMKEAEQEITREPLSYSEEAKIITARSTKHEPSKPAQHKARRLFSAEQWVKANEDGDEKAIDRMVRQATGWRMDTIPNIKPHWDGTKQDEDQCDCNECNLSYAPHEITDKHHKIDALSLQPSRSAPSYSSQPLFHMMKRHLFRGEGENAKLLDKEMAKVAKGLHPELKGKEHFTNWEGANANLEKMFSIGFNDFKDDFKEKFPDSDYLTLDESLRSLFIWNKNWENEGIPREYIFKNCYNETGDVKGNSGVPLRKLVDTNQRIQTDDGEWHTPSLNKIGTDAYRFGIYMLPNDMVRKVKRWMMDGAGTESEGEVENMTHSIDDRALGAIFGNSQHGSDYRGFMAHHGRLINSVMRHGYAGGSLRRGYTQTIPNRYLRNSKEAQTIKNSEERFKVELKDKMEDGKGFNELKDKQYANILDNININDVITDYAEENDMNVIGAGKYPHISKDFFGHNEIKMTDEPPNMQNLVDGGVFDNHKEELNEIIERATQKRSRDTLTGIKNSSMDGYHYTQQADEDWIDPKDAKMSLTALGILQQSMGGFGNLDGEWDDIPQLREGAMPGMWFDKLPTVNLASAFRRPVKTPQKNPVLRRREFEKTGDSQLDLQAQQDLSTLISNEDIHNGDELVAQFLAGEKVNVPIERDREHMTRTEKIMPTSYEDYIKDMPQPRSVRAKGQYSFFGPETSYLDSDLKGSTGLMGLDGLDNNVDKLSHHPMSQINLKRDNAYSKGHEKLLFAEQLHTGQVNHIKHDKFSPQDRLLIPVGVFGAHKGIHQRDEESLKAFQRGTIHHDRHSDPLGINRSSNHVLNELTTEAPIPPSHFTIYKKSDYDEYLANRGNLGFNYSLPPAHVEGSKTRSHLLQELLNNDSEYQDGDEGARRERKKVMTELITKKGFKDGSTFGVTTDGDQYTVAPSRAYLTMVDKQETINRRHREEDDTKRDLYDKKIASINTNGEYDSRTPQVSHWSDKDKMSRDTHNATKRIFNLLRPSVEKHFPDAFGKEGMTDAENNKAYATTAYMAHISEYIATHLSPTQQSKLFTEGVAYHGLANKVSIGGHLDTDGLSAMNEGFETQRERGINDFSRLRLLEDVFNGEQPKGHELMSKLAEGIKGNHALGGNHLEMFNKVIHQVQEAAKEQGISFEDAFSARYFPCERLQKAIKRDRPTAVMDARRLEPGEGVTNSHAGFIGKDYSEHEQHLDVDKRGSNYIHNFGGKHKEFNNFLHGGDSVKINHIPQLMSQELMAIHAVINHAQNQISPGSDVAFLGKGIKQNSSNKIIKPSGIFPYSVKRRHQSFNTMRSLAHALNDTTSPHKGKYDTEPQATVTGGHDLNHATLPPVYTSRAYAHEHGYEVLAPFTINKEGLHQDKPMMSYESQKFNLQNPPNSMQLFVPADGMYDLNPALRGYNPEVSNDIKYQSFDTGLETNPNTSFGARAQTVTSLQSPNIITSLDVVMDETLLIKEDGKPQPIKFMHRIFDLEDIQHLRGFTGDWVISLYPQGEHIILVKTKKKLTAYSANGNIKLESMFKEEVGKVYEKDFVAHAIMHDGIITFIDLLKVADEDTHNMPTKDRIRHLRAQFESTEHIKMPEPINTKRSDDEGLQVAVEGLRSENNQDILLRDAGATYMKGEPRHPKWVLLSKEKMVDVIIISRAGTNYTIGVGPLMHPEHYGKRAQQVGEEHYMSVGSAKGPRGLNVGDFATVRCTGVSASKSEHIVYRIRSAKITDNEPLAANSVETLSILSGEHNVPQRVKMSKGKIIITFTAFDDEVICKTRKEEGLWTVEPQSSLWGNEYLVRLAKDQEPYWETSAALLLLKEHDIEQPEYDEVDPEAPAGHRKKRKHVIPEEEEVIKRGLEVIERGLEHLSKEKITSTGVQGLGIGYATPDESPKGPTENIRDDTMPDFDPQARKPEELVAATEKKKKKLTTSHGETARLEDDGVIAIENSSFDIA